MSKSPKPLNIKQLAERLNMPLRTVHYQLQRETFPIPHIDGIKPRKWRVADVDAFIRLRDGE